MTGWINLQEKTRRAFLEISEFNLYIQIAVTIISTSVHWFNTRTINCKGALIEIITIHVIGFSSWFAIMSGLLAHILNTDEVATRMGWRLSSGFQISSIGFGLVGFRSST